MKRTISVNLFLFLFLICTKAAIVAPSVELKGSDYAVRSITNGQNVFLNRSYIFENVPTELQGWQYTQINGKGYSDASLPRATIELKASADGYIYSLVSDVATEAAVTTAWVTAQGWEKIPEYYMNYNDGGKTKFYLYRKTCVKDQWITIVQPQTFCGVMICAPTIISPTAVVSPPPGVVIHNSLSSTLRFTGSPSIVIMPDGSYVASHDDFGNFVSDTHIYKSLDRGLTWTKTADIKVCTWSTLFNRGNELYLIGIQPNGSSWYGYYVIRKSLDGGTTWTSPIDANTGLLLTGYHHCAPVPVVNHNGRIWRAIEDMNTAGGWGPFSALMTSVPENVDLLKASNWTFSNELLYNSNFRAGTSAWLEGNAVVAPDGKIKDVLRVAYSPDDLAAICSVSDDGKTFTFNPTTDFITLPGACKKFTIRYDNVTKKYWSLTNYVLAKDRVSGDNGAVRNTQVLIYSSDLRNWTIKDTVLHVDEKQFHAFQYLDWQFDGEDIVAVSRTAWDDAGGLPPNFHNANFITFHRIRNFRYDRPSVEGKIEVAKWYNNAKSAVALTFDDGFKGFYDYAFPVLEKYKINATFFVNSSKLVNKGNALIERYGYWEDFAEMAAAGHEVASHSVTHADLTAIDANALHNELANDKAMIESKIPSQKCLTHAYPFCKNNQIVRDTASNYFLAARQCGSVANNSSLKPADWMGVNSNLLTWGSPRTLANEKALATQTQNEITNQLINTGKFGVYCIHEVITFAKLNTTTSYEPCTTEWLEDICTFMDEKRTNGDLWPTTFANIIRYAQMRDNLRVLNVYSGTDSLAYAFTDGLNDAIFTLPITMHIVLPDNFKNVIIYKNNVLVQTTNVTNQRIQVSAVPDKDVISIKNETQASSVQSTYSQIFRCYPNPFKQELYIEFEKELNDATIYIADITGKTMLIQQMNLTASRSNKIISSNIPRGYYTLSIFKGDALVAQQKICK